MARPARRAAAFPTFPLSALAGLVFLVAATPAFAIDEPKRPGNEEAGLLNAVDSANQSIVTVIGYPMRYGPPRPGQKLKRLIGTGVVASEHSLITTASMALPGGTLSVLLGRGVTREARLVGVDRKSNLALFEVSEGGLTPLHRASPRSLAVGAWVAVISNVAITRPQAALGRVSGRGERVDFPYAGDIVEIDAPTYLGATGAAVLNEEGDWVALVVGRAALSQAGAARDSDPVDGPMPQPNSLLLALPVDQVDRITTDLKEHGSVRQAFLGVRLVVDTEDTLGVRVVKVAAGSPAEKAGIRVEDRILAIDGEEMRTSEEITTLVRGMRPGEEIDITILRDGDIKSVPATLGSTTSDRPLGDSPQDPQIRELRENLERLHQQERDLQEKLKKLEEHR